MKQSSSAPRGASQSRQAAASATRERLALDQAAIEVAKSDLQAGAVTPHFGPWRE